jgi:hypothetical protein
MGQPVSKAPTTAPFENYYQVYTGPTVVTRPAAMARQSMSPMPQAGMYINNDIIAPSQIGYSEQVQPSRQEMYRAQRGGPMPPRRGYLPQDDMGYNPDDFMGEIVDMGRRPQFDPLQSDRRFYPQREDGIAQGMINDVRQQTQQRVSASRVPNYRSRPPPGYVQPMQGGQGYSQPAQLQQAPVQPQQVTMYYDPQTGVIQNPTQGTTAQYGVQQNPAQAQQPMYLSYQQPTQAAPTMGYQQPQPVGYQQATGQAPMGYQGYMMPQYGMQNQPIVIPAQVISK